MMIKLLRNLWEWMKRDPYEPKYWTAPTYITIEEGGTLDLSGNEQRRISLLSKREPYPYGTWVELHLWNNHLDQPQWVPMRAVNHGVDKFGQLWIKVTIGADGEDWAKFWVPSGLVRKFHPTVIPFAEGKKPEGWDRITKENET